MALVSWFCDHFRIRGPVMIFNSILYIIGLCLSIPQAPENTQTTS